jgi:uncharacterized LabA/DUF88 family protein
VTVISTMAVRPPMVADELRRQADQFIDLNSLKDLVGRAPSGNRQHNRDDEPDQSFEEFAEI